MFNLIIKSEQSLCFQIRDISFKLFVNTIKDRAFGIGIALSLYLELISSMIFYTSYLHQIVTFLLNKIQ